MVAKRCSDYGLARASYGADGKCYKCQTGTMTSHGRKCLFPGCETRSDTVRGHAWCANHDTERKRMTRIRENKVGNFLRESVLPPWTSWNKQIQGAEKDVCSKYRPDFVWELP